MNSTIEEQEPTADGPKGIGGWLLLPTIYLFISVLISFGYLVFTFLFINSSEWKQLITSPEVHPHFENAIYFEMACNALLLVFTIYLIVVLFKKKRIFPKGIISYYLLSIVIDIVVTLLVNNVSMDDEITSFSGSGIALSIIWIAYFMLSKRVRNTFVNE